MVAAEVDVVEALIEIVLQFGIRRQLETDTQRHAEAVADAPVVLQIE